MIVNQNNRERILDLVQRGELTVDEGNVEMVRAQGIMLVLSKLPHDVRKALNAGVKVGRLRHLKKDGAKPEAYYHPSSEIFVAAERNKHVREKYAAVASVCGGIPSIYDYSNEDETFNG